MRSRAFPAPEHERIGPIDTTAPDAAEAQRGPGEWFSGEVSIQPIGRQPPPGRAQAAIVAFEPGARTAWHTHPFGQILFIVEGPARVQTAGGEVVELEQGASVRFEAGEEHWHGASPHTRMVHLAVQEADADGVAAVWGRHVTDAEYAGGD